MPRILGSMSSELSPQLGYQSLSARCTDAGDTRLLSSHYEIVEQAAAAGDAQASNFGWWFGRLCTRNGHLGLDVRVLEGHLGG